MIVVDIEANGLSPLKNSIVSIGAVDFENPTNQFYQECQMWDGSLIDMEALAVCGFSKKQITDSHKPLLQIILKDFLIWAEPIKVKIIAGENPSFDRDFLRETAYRYQIPWKFGHRTFDLHSVCLTHNLQHNVLPIGKEGTSELNLDKTLAFCGLPIEPHPHNALNGAKLEAEAFSRLLYGKKLLADYKEYAIPKALRIRIPAHT